MNEIRPGILVEIVDRPGFISHREFIGHIGIVLRRSEYVGEFGPAWVVEGTVHLLGDGWSERALRPIDDGIVDKLIEKWQRESRQGVPA